MPELPEAETIARDLHERLRGLVVERVTLTRRELLFGDRRPLNTTLGGRRIARISRRAKRVVFTFDPKCTFIVRLGMTGRLTVCAPEEPRDRHVHLRMRFVDSPLELRFRDVRRFGDLWCLTGKEKPGGKELGKLGPEPLELKLRGFRALLHRQRAIKALLLDQGIIAGLGNIYCDEALFAARIHPLTPAGQVDEEQAKRLLRAIKTTLRKSISCGGTTFLDYRTPTGETGKFIEHLRVYQRQGEPCKTCKQPLIRIQVAGRSTFVCPQCQPAPSGIG